MQHRHIHETFAFVASVSVWEISVWPPEKSREPKNERRGRGGEKTLVDKPLDCEQSLIFLCKVTTRETQAQERRSRHKRRGLQSRWMR